MNTIKGEATFEIKPFSFLFSRWKIDYGIEYKRNVAIGLELKKAMDL